MSSKSKAIEPKKDTTIEVIKIDEQKDGSAIVELEMSKEAIRLFVQKAFVDILTEKMQVDNPYLFDEMIKVEDERDGTVAKGQQDEGTYLAFVNKDDLGEHSVDLPDELLEKMGWNPGDQIEVGICDNLFDWGEMPGLALRNLTKERNNGSK